MKWKKKRTFLNKLIAQRMSPHPATLFAAAMSDSCFGDSVIRMEINARMSASHSSFLEYNNASANALDPTAGMPLYLSTLETTRSKSGKVRVSSFLTWEEEKVK